MNKFIFLSENFYKAYSAEKYPEIERKPDRPYVEVCVVVDRVRFAVPLRSNIEHKYVLWTDRENHCGLDFSKAVVIEREEYIDTTRTPYIRDNEFKVLKGKEYIIMMKMRRYIEKYRAAKRKPHIRANRRLCAYSTMQYFEQYILCGKCEGTQTGDDD